MRKVAWRLSLLIVVASVSVAAPARAADEGEVGIHERVVRVAARATIPGVRVSGGADPDGCVWQVVIEDDRLPMYDTDGTGLFSDTGRWFQRMCNGQPVEVNGLFVVPEGGGFAIPDLAEQAFDALDPSEPVWSASPNGTTVAMLVQLPTWLWVEPGYWNAIFVARVATPSGRVWAEARARPTSATWDTGDGQSTSCDDGGTVWEPGSPATTISCSHTFRHSSAGTPGRPVTATVDFAVEGRTTTNPTVVAIGAISRTSPPLLVQVAEIQAIGTNGP